MAGKSSRNNAPKLGLNAARQITQTILLVLIIAAIPVVTGGYGRREVEDMAFVLALGFDKTEAGLYRVTSQVAVPAKSKDGGGGGGSLPVVVVTSTGKSIAEAMAKLSHSSNKEPFWGQVRLAVFGERLAREGLLPALDFLARNHEPRVTMWTLVTPGSAEDILTAKSETENIPALFMSGLEEETKFHGTAPRTMLFQTLLSVESVTDDPFLPRIVPAIPGEEIKSGESGEEGKKEGGGGTANAVTLDGAGVFQDDKLVGWMTPSEARGILWLRGEVTATTVNYDDPTLGVSGAVRVFIARRETHVSVDPDNLKSAKITFIIHTDANLVEYLGGPAPSARAVHSVIEAAVAKSIRNDITAGLQRAQKDYGADVVGLGELVREKLSNATWEQVEKEWFSAYPNISVDVQIDFKLRRPGLVNGRIGLGRSR